MFEDIDLLFEIWSCDYVFLFVVDCVLDSDAIVGDFVQDHRDELLVEGYVAMSDFNRVQEPGFYMDTSNTHNTSFLI